jgi:hypothetical protein
MFYSFCAQISILKGTMGCSTQIIYRQFVFNILTNIYLYYHSFNNQKMKMSSCHSLLPLLFLIIGFLQCFSAETSGHGKTAESTAAAGLATKRRLKVLVFSPAYCWSHVQYMSRIADTLQEAGHEAVSEFVEYLIC